MKSGREYLSLAKCYKCPLKRATNASGEDWNPVPAELHEGTNTIVIGQAPGKREVSSGQPFIGPRSEDLRMAMAAEIISRSDLSYTNVVACRYPYDDPKKWKATFRKKVSSLTAENKRRKGAGLRPLPVPETAESCCAPRLKAELAEFDNWIPTGAQAVKFVFPKHTDFELRRGAPHRGENGALPLAAGKKLLPTIHPAFVRRYPHWRWVFQSDFA